MYEVKGVRELWRISKGVVEGKKGKGRKEWPKRARFEGRP